MVSCLQCGSKLADCECPLEKWRIEELEEEINNLRAELAKTKEELRLIKESPCYSEFGRLDVMWKELVKERDELKFLKDKKLAKAEAERDEAIYKFERLSKAVKHTVVDIVAHGRALEAVVSDVIQERDMKKEKDEILASKESYWEWFKGEYPEDYSRFNIPDLVVGVVFTDETGEDVWAVFPRICPDFWLWSFSKISQAEQFIKMMGWKLTTTGEAAGE